VAASVVPTVEREAMDLQNAFLAKFNTESLEFPGILLRLTLKDTMRNVFDVAWQESKEQRNALDKSLLLELEQGKKKKLTTSPREATETKKATTKRSRVMTWQVVN
jgi:Protein of unknown function (DUF3684)